MDLRSLQKPLKEQYRADPKASRITIRGERRADWGADCVLGGHWARDSSGRSA